MHRFLSLACAALVAACGAAPVAAPVTAPADPQVLLLGEQHDARDHQRLHFETVRDLAARGRLVALVLEMADRGASTAQLPRDADEASVRRALGWNERAWPWQPYAPAIMAAVRAGIPVLGANLPRREMRSAMADDTLDRVLPPEVLEQQRTAIRSGHCGLLPETQVPPMARVQIARDRSMADLLAQAARADGTVVLLAGSGHVDPVLGVPRHLPPGLRVQPLAWPPAPPKKDYCAELRQQFERRR